jgi:hypothetical protein
MRKVLAENTVYNTRSLPIDLWQYRQIYFNIVYTMRREPNTIPSLGVPSLNIILQRSYMF